VSPGAEIIFTVKVANQGTAPVTQRIPVHVPGGQDGFITGGLKPGEAKEVKVSCRVHSQNGTHRIRLKVDSENLITESNKKNNESQEFVIRTTL
jgi:uncharacterized membrane protein